MSDDSKQTSFDGEFDEFVVNETDTSPTSHPYIGTHMSGDIILDGCFSPKMLRKLCELTMKYYPEEGKK